MMQAIQQVFWLIVVFALIQIIVGALVAGSMAAVADGFHSLFDLAGITIAQGVAILRKGKSLSERKKLETADSLAITIGIICTTALTIAGIGVTVLTLTGIGVYRLIAGIKVEHPWLMFLLGGLGVAVNIIALRILKGQVNEERHIYSAYIHNFISSAFVMTGAIAIIVAKVHFIDSVITFAIVLFLIALARHIIYY
jgi:Co/Zn/Cd efflux system component